VREKKPAWSSMPPSRRSVRSPLPTRLGRDMALKMAEAFWH